MPGRYFDPSYPDPGYSQRGGHTGGEAAGSVAMPGRYFDPSYPDPGYSTQKGGAKKKKKSAKKKTPPKRKTPSPARRKRKPQRGGDCPVSPDVWGQSGINPTYAQPGYWALASRGQTGGCGCGAKPAVAKLMPVSGASGGAPVFALPTSVREAGWPAQSGGLPLAGGVPRPLSGGSSGGDVLSRYAAADTPRPTALAGGAPPGLPSRIVARLVAEYVARSAPSAPKIRIRRDAASRLGVLVRSYLSSLVRAACTAAKGRKLTPKDVRRAAKRWPPAVLAFGNV